MTATLLLDFDGTVCVGDDPVWSYAGHVGDLVDRDVARAIDDGLRDYLAGHHDSRFADGYQAVQALAGDLLSPAELQEAYLASRIDLAAGKLVVAAPRGLADFLAATSARKVLVTNSPRIGIDETLSAIGLVGVFDEIITDAGKPDGLDPIVETILDGADAATLLSIGDIWRNDLRGPHEMGCATAYIDRFGRGDGAPDMSAPDFPGLYSPISQWLEQRENDEHETPHL
ncbi:HAD family hydrolase [Nocardia camponoti]|uniref:HAD family hydrolase n=1 Tax=Nocardia camponoti TaxID=1616106 RepID=A0A917QTY8_9NOCA|nr:HAD family hydrolase [Nocardia camponoti]GGK67223.1 hypothetical protein GCM10011591_44220 [Nocardia camponoti]